MKRRRVVITGIGVMAPNGIGKETFWDALAKGRSGIDYVSRFDVSMLPTKIAGEVKDSSFSNDPIDQKKPLARQTRMARAAAQMALDDARLQKDRMEGLRRLTCIGVCNPAYDLIEPEVLKVKAAGVNSATPGTLKHADTFFSASLISYLFDFNHAAKSFSTSCNSGLSAVGEAFKEIRRGAADIAIAGAADSPLSTVAFASFCAAGMLTTRNDPPHKASRPFDKFRDGGVLSEGAGVLILEEYQHALSRGAHTYAEVLGYGANAVSVNPKRTEEGFVSAMREALSDGNVSPTEIDFISAHGPSDPQIDRIETAAIKKSLLRHAYLTPVSSIKSMIGNPLSAAGPLQIVAAVLAIEKGIISPTINLENEDPECDLDYVPNTARRGLVSIAMVITHGFNGTDACLILGSPTGR